MTALEAMSYVRRVGTHCVSLLRSGPEHMTVNCSVSREDDHVLLCPRHRELVTHLGMDDGA